MGPISEPLLIHTDQRVLSIDLSPEKYVLDCAWHLLSKFNDERGGVQAPNQVIAIARMV